MGRKPERRSERVGKWGRSVRLFERKPGGPLYLGYYEGKKLVKKSLEYRADEVFKRNGREETGWDRGLREARKLADADDPSADVDRPVTWGETRVLYVQEALPGQCAEAQTHSETRLELWDRQLGLGFDLRQFDVTDWNGFVRSRSSGQIDARGRPVQPEKRKPVGPRVVAADLELLRSACQLATLKRTGPGRFLLDKNPTRGLPVPKNPNVRRGRYDDNEYCALLAAAKQVHEYLPTLLVVAHDTGRRLRAYLKLRWSDWLPAKGPHGSIAWREENDKLETDWVTPVTREVREALEQHRQRCPGVGDAWVFPDPRPRRPDRHLQKWEAHRWLVRCEKLAGVEHKPHRAFHGFRRQFATETKHLSTKDVMALGGWKDSRTLERAYQSADLETMAEVLENRRRLRRAQ